MHNLIILILLIISFKGFPNQLNSKEDLKITLEKIRVQYEIPAMAVAVISSGEVNYIKGFGFLDKTKLKPATKDSTFRIASITKIFTAQAIMKLVEEEKLSLDDNIGKYLSAFTNYNITIKQLLTHSSGVNDTILPANIDNQRTQQKYLERVQKSSISEGENKVFEYSDTGFNILGSVISAVSGDSYERYVYHNILLPSGMYSSVYFDGKNEDIVDASPSYKGKTIDKIDQRHFDLWFNPSEGLVASVHDLSRWLTITLTNDTSLLNLQSYQTMINPQIKTVWGEIYMGLGWQVYENEGAVVARHPGSIKGYKSLIISYPETKDALILLTNSSDTPRWEIAKALTKILKQHDVW